MAPGGGPAPGGGGAGAGPTTGEGTETTASDWAVMPSSAFGFRAEAPNTTGASATTCARSWSPSEVRSSAARKRDPSQRKM